MIEVSHVAAKDELRQVRGVFLLFTPKQRKDSWDKPVIHTRSCWYSIFYVELLLVQQSLRGIFLENFLDATHLFQRVDELEVRIRRRQLQFKQETVHLSLAQ